MYPEDDQETRLLWSRWVIKGTMFYHI